MPFSRRMAITKWKKPVLEGYILYDSNCVMFWEMQNSADNKKSTFFPEITGEEGMKRQSTEYF